MTPPTRYTQSHGADIAYRVLGEGATDIVFIMPFVSHLDMYWESPEWGDLLRQLSGWGRLILFDRRGTGLSDRQLTGITPEQGSDDIIAVMDAAGSERAVLFGWLDAAAISLLTAARRPDRVSAVIAGEALAVGHRDVDHPFGINETIRQMARDAFAAGAWGQGLLVRSMTPELTLSPQQIAWCARFESMAATPRAAAQLFEMNADLDLRPHLAAIEAPVLLLHDLGFGLVPAEGVRWLADRLPRATLKTTNSSSADGTGRPFENALEEVEDFLLGTRTAGGASHEVATLLVTDLVESTETAARGGDLSWNNLLMAHRAAIRLALKRFGGVEIDTAGDGFLASFTLPTAALRCASEVAAEASAVGLAVRAGVHSGEVIRHASGVIGIAVHIAARVAGAAGRNEVLFTDTVRALVMGAEVRYEEAGVHALKGVPGEWPLYRLLPPAGAGGRFAPATPGSIIKT